MLSPPRRMMMTMMTPPQRRKRQITPNQTVCVRHCFLPYCPAGLALGFGREVGDLVGCLEGGRRSGHMGSSCLTAGSSGHPGQCGHGLQLLGRGWGASRSWPGPLLLSLTSPLPISWLSLSSRGSVLDVPRKDGKEIACSASCQDSEVQMPFQWDS